MKRKNLRPVGGVPLVARAVATALECERIDEVIVSTDDREIASVAEHAGANVPWLRPAELASGTAPELLSWKHAIEWATTRTPTSERIETFVSVPPTAPLRTAEDLTATIDRYRASACDAVVTGTAARRHPAFNMVRVNNEGLVELAAPSDARVARRQDASTLFDLATVAYVADPGFVVQTDRLLAGRVVLHEVSERSAWDVDTEFDLQVADLLAIEEEAR